MPHQSVLLKQVISTFEDMSISTFVDATLGAGGHTSAILAAHPEINKYYGFDQDPEAMLIAKERLFPYDHKIQYVPSNFANLKSYIPADSVDGILVDLGVSSMQLDRAEKGFSFRKDGPLDMRMDPTNPLSAWNLVNEWDERELAVIIRDYGEEKRWKQAARAIVQAREKAPIMTTLELSEILEPVLRDYKSKIHPSTKVFQALRIATNKELDVLISLIPQALDCLKPGGRLGIISFHSLEDRIVKHTFRELASDKVSTSGIGGVFLSKDPLVKILTRKGLKADDEEIEGNPRARSATYRAVEKLA